MSEKIKKIILASSSPRRRDIMNEVGLHFEIHTPDCDENLINKTFEYKKIEEIAKKKCESVASKINYSALVISADTVVIYNSRVMGKPQNFEEAFKMLSILNGKTHKVVTAICIKNTKNGKMLIKSDTSEVTFGKISEEEIKDYIKIFEPYDKAGSYGIQELPENFGASVNGDYDNVVGLPVKMLMDMLLEFDVKKEKEMNSNEFVKNKIRSIKDFPAKGIIFRDITTAIKDKDALKEMINFLTEKFKNQGIDYVAVVESRGFVFGSALAYNIDAGCILIRKPGKLPAETISQEYELEYGTDKLEIHKDAVEQGKKVIVIDDLLATGGTVAAACKLLKKTGADVKAAAFIIELEELNGRKNLPDDIDVVSMIKY